MIYFKSCPRCSGDVYESQDMYGYFLTCWQCGHTEDLKEEHPTKPVHRVRRNLSEFSQSERKKLLEKSNIIPNKHCGNGHLFTKHNTWYSISIEDKIVQHCLTCKVIREN